MARDSPSGPPIRKATSRPPCMRAASQVLSSRVRHALAALIERDDVLALAQRSLQTLRFDVDGLPSGDGRRRAGLARSQAGRASGRCRNGRRSHRTPSRTQRGIRVPTAMTRRRMGGQRRQCAFFARFFGRSAGCVGFPETLEPIELAHARQHHVHHDILQIHQHPFAFARAFLPSGRTPAALASATTRSAMERT